MTPLDSRIDEDFVCRLYRGEPFVFEGQLEDKDGAVEDLTGRTFWGCIMAADGSVLHEVVAEILTENERQLYRGVFDGSVSDDCFGRSGLIWSQGEHVTDPRGRKIHAQGALIIYPGPGSQAPSGSNGIAAITHRTVRREAASGRSMIRISQQGARGPTPWEAAGQSYAEWFAEKIDAPLAAERIATLTAVASQIPSLSVPIDVDIIRLSGYNTASKGQAAPAYIKTTKPGVKAYRIEDASGQRWQLIADTIKPKELGATGKRDVDSTQGLVEAFGWAKELAQALMSGAPDEVHPRGMPIDLGTGFYETNQPITIFDRLSLRGSSESWAEDGAVIRTSATSLLTKSQIAAGSSSSIDNFSLRGMSLIGRSDMTTKFIDNIASVGAAQPFKGSFLENLNLLQLLPPFLYLLASRYARNQHSRMPFGNLRVGGSDSVVEDNFFNGDAFGSFVAAYDADPVVYVQNLDNSRYRRNYNTGTSFGAGIARYPMTTFFDLCDELIVEDNWFDLSNTCVAMLRNVTSSSFSKNRYCRFALNPPSIESGGGAVEASRFNAAITMIGCTDVTFANEEFRQIGLDNQTAATINVLDNATVTDRIRITDPIAANHNFSIANNGTQSRAGRMWVRHLEREIREFAANLNAPYVMGALYSHTGAGAVVTLPTAIKDRRFRVYQNGTGATGFNVPEAAGTSPIVGQAGMTKVRVPASDAGKFVEFYCVTPGKWLVTSDAPGLTYAP